MQLFQWLSVKFHVPPVSNRTDHFKQSLLKIPNSSFSWKIPIYQQCLLTTTSNILRVLQIWNVLRKNSISFYSLSSFTLHCMQSPRSTSYDDHPPISMIKYAGHVSNAPNDVINTLETRHLKNQTKKNDDFSIRGFLVAL